MLIRVILYKFVQLNLDNYQVKYKALLNLYQYYFIPKVLQAKLYIMAYAIKTSEDLCYQIHTIVNTINF